LVEEAQHALCHQRFGREIEQLQTAIANLVGHAALLFQPQGAVHAGGRHSAIGKRIDLIFHERDQRRNNDGQPLHRERGCLKAQRFAAAGRQHDYRVAARQHRLHRLWLQRTKALEAPNLAKNAAKLFHRRESIPYFGLLFPTQYKCVDVRKKSCCPLTAIEDIVNVPSRSFVTSGLNSGPAASTTVTAFSPVMYSLPSANSGEAVIVAPTFNRSGP
jgi:hypothetical protein